MRTVSNLRQNVSAILVGADLDLVGDLYGTFERAVSTTIQKADVPEASARQPLMLYDGVTDYNISQKIFGSSLIDLRPQGVERNYWDDVAKRFIVEFDRTKQWKPRGGYEVAFEYYEGVPIIRIAQDKTEQRISIDPMDSLDGWAAGGDSNTLLLDNTVYYHQPAALRFNLAASGSSGTLVKTLDNALDLTRYQGVGVAFLAAYFPHAENITGVTLRIGSDPSNYYWISVTEGFLGTLVSNDYQLIAFDLANATQVGSPVITAMDYVEILTQYDGTAQNNVRYGDLWISLPFPHELLYYSAAAFQPSYAAGEPIPPFQTTITNDEDNIIFRDAAYNIYLYEAARAIAQNQGAGIASDLIAGIDLVLEGRGEKAGLYQQFRGDNPSEELREIGSWYDGLDRFNGG